MINRLYFAFSRLSLVWARKESPYCSRSMKSLCSIAQACTLGNTFQFYHLYVSISSNLQEKNAHTMDCGGQTGHCHCHCHSHPTGRHDCPEHYTWQEESKVTVTWSWICHQEHLLYNWTTFRQQREYPIYQHFSNGAHEYTNTPWKVNKSCTQVH